MIEREAYWARHDQFANDLVSPEEAVAGAARATAHPVILVDTGDNIGGGTPADGTMLLRLLHERNMPGLVIVCDPDAVQACANAGVGSEITAPVGGRGIPEQGGPVTLTGRVRMLFEGRYIHTGMPQHDLEEAARPMALLVSGGLKVILTSHRMVPGDLQQFRAMGIDPAQEPIIVVKATSAWREYYDTIAKTVYFVATPGFSSLDHTKFTFKNRLRPLFPWERDVTWP